jgi:hypothetical protein
VAKIPEIRLFLMIESKYRRPGWGHHAAFDPGTDQEAFSSLKIQVTPNILIGDNTNISKYTFIRGGLSV